MKDYYAKIWKNMRSTQSCLCPNQEETAAIWSCGIWQPHWAKRIKGPAKQRA